MKQNLITRRGFPVAIADIERAKVLARASGQSLNSWVQRAIRSGLDAPKRTVSADDLAAHEHRLGALVDRMERAIIGRVLNATDEGLDELRLDGETS
jgi:hypothetical protein